jgi:general secretion pathway protein G
MVLLPMMRRVDTAKRTAAHAQINGFMTALGTYKLDTGTFPTTEEGLKALREKPEGVNGWQGPYLQKDLPKDPWKNDYVYKYPGDHGDEPDVVSYGLDGQPGGDGNNADIVSWKND